MALRSPANALAINRRAFVRSEPVIAGESTDDEPYGLRGLHSQVHHTYAERLRVIFSGGRPAVGGSAALEYIKSTASAVGIQLVSVPWQLAQDVAEARFVAVVEDLEVRVSSSGSTGAWSVFSSPTGVGNREVEDLTHAVATAGADEEFTIDIRAVGGGTGYLYLALLLEEPLEVADFPTTAPPVYDSEPLALQLARNGRPPVTQIGTKWTRPSVTEMQLEADAEASKAIVSVWDAAGNRVDVGIDTAHTWDITASGLGGHSAGSEAASTVYLLYLVTKSAGRTPKLISTVSGTPLTYGVLSGVDSSYLMMSKPIGFARNDSSSDLMDIEGIGGKLRYKAPEASRRILSSWAAGSYTDHTATVDLWLPKTGERVFTAQLSGGTTSTGFGLSNDGTDLIDFVTCDPSAGIRRVVWPGTDSFWAYRWGGNNSLTLQAFGANL